MKRWEPKVGDVVIVHMGRKMPSIEGTIVKELPPIKNLVSSPRFEVHSKDYFMPLVRPKHELRPTESVIERLKA